MVKHGRVGIITDKNSSGGKEANPDHRNRCHWECSRLVIVWDRSSYCAFGSKREKTDHWETGDQYTLFGYAPKYRAAGGEYIIPLWSKISRTMITMKLIIVPVKSNQLHSILPQIAHACTNKNSRVDIFIFQNIWYNNLAEIEVCLPPGSYFLTPYYGRRPGWKGDLLHYFRH